MMLSLTTSAQQLGKATQRRIEQQLTRFVSCAERRKQRLVNPAAFAMVPVTVVPWPGSSGGCRGIGELGVTVIFVGTSRNDK